MSKIGNGLGLVHLVSSPRRRQDTTCFALFSIYSYFDAFFPSISFLFICMLFQEVFHDFPKLEILAFSSLIKISTYLFLLYNFLSFYFPHGKNNGYFIRLLCTLCLDMVKIIIANSYISLPENQCVVYVDLFNLQTLL